MPRAESEHPSSGAPPATDPARSARAADATPQEGAEFAPQLRVPGAPIPA